MSKSKIEWTDETWNPVTGCTKVSSGCKHCYAERIWPRLAGNTKHVAYGRPFTDVQCHPERLEQAVHWKKPRRVFVNSISDLFHPSVPYDFINKVFYTIIYANENHVFQILTKRPERMLHYIQHEAICWPIPNVLLGVSVEDQTTANLRIPVLLRIPKALRFISIEPMLGHIDLSNIQFTKNCQMDVLDGTGVDRIAMAQSIPNAFCNKLDWVILGGESGRNARPMHQKWIRWVRDHCVAAGVPFFFKQWGNWVGAEIHADEESIGIIKCQNDTVIDLEQMFPCEEDEERMSAWFKKNISELSHFTQAWTDPVTCYSSQVSFRSGKKAAGRMLDGREWNEYPRIAP